MSQGDLGLDEDDFWSNPLKTKRAKTTALMMDDFFGLVLDGPTLVPLDQRDTIPLVALRVCTMVDAARLQFRDFVNVTVVDLHENAFSAAPAIVDRPNMQRPPIDPAEPIPEGAMGEAFVLQLQERVAVKMTAGRDLLVTLVLRDAVSNRIRIQLGASDLGFRDPEVERFLEEQRALVPPPPLHPAPGNRLPKYEKIAGSPKVPEEPGIALAIDRVIVADPTKELVLRGSFRLPRGDARLVRPEHAAQFSAPAPTAVVRIAVMLTGSEVAAPIVLPLVVPSYDPPASIEASGVITGHFAFDLMQFGNLKRHPQTFFIYAFSGETMAGPAVLGLVPEGRLPRP